MPREGSLTPADLSGRIQTITVECSKCDRRGRYRVRMLVREIGLDGRLTDWLARISADCPRRKNPSISGWCGAHCPDMVALFRDPE
jgi:hypothetical protein